MKRGLVVAGMILCTTTGALAEDKPPSRPGTPSASPEANFAKREADKQSALSKDIAEVLAKSGFTDLQVMPNSVLVRGKDKAGQPVAMILNPGSMTEVVTLDPHSGSAASGRRSHQTGGRPTPS